MSKRFTDTEKWKKAWFRKLPQKEKLFWFYILDNCNHAGIWDVDLDAASFYIGSKIDASIIQGALKGHISPLKDNTDKWYIIDFVEFQYGKLNENNRVHKSVLALINKYNLDDPSKGLTSPMQGCKDKDKAKDNDKAKDIKKPYGEFQNVMLTDEEYKKLSERLEPNQLKYAIEQLSGYKAEKGKKYDSDYAVFRKGHWLMQKVDDKYGTGSRYHSV